MCVCVCVHSAGLRSSVDYVRSHPELCKSGNAATYGLISKIPSDTIVDQFLVSYLDKVLQPSPSPLTSTSDTDSDSDSAAAGAGPAGREGEQLQGDE